MMKDLAEFSIDYLKERGVDYAEARLETINSSGFMLNNSNPEVSGFDQSSGLGIRFLIKNNMGFTSINALNKEKIKKELDKSIRLTKRAAKISEKVKLAHSKSLNKKCIIKPKEILDEEQKISYLKDLDKELKAEHKYLSLSDSITEKYYINTDGTKIFQSMPRINFLYFLTLVNNNESIQRYLQFGATSGHEILKKWKLKAHIQEEIKALKNNLIKGVKMPSGEFDVVVAPEVTGIATHEAIGHPYEADRIMGRESAQAGESFVKEDMINTQIGSEVVTAVDDPTLEGSYGFFKYDDEGVEARENVLMKNGKINDFLHNRETAAQMGIKSNGCARANSYSVEPMVRMSNTYVKPGKQTEEELIKDIKKGVYIKNFMEWNIDDKRYQQKYVGDEAYLIENGEITKPVKSPTIEITTPKLWSSVDAVANNLQHFAGTCGKGEPMQGIPVFMGGPSMRLRKIRFN
jgi:TldD protein